MKKKIIKALKITLGSTLIILGVIGLFLPIIQGILLIIAGLFLLGIQREKLNEWIMKLKKKIFGF